MSLIMSRENLDFLLWDWLGTEQLFDRPRFADHSRETVGALMEVCEQIATEHFAPHNRASDLHEPTFDGHTVSVIPEVGRALRVFGDAGLVAAALPASVGGGGLPASVTGACMSWFHAANIGTAGYAMLTLAAANLLAAHGSAEQIDTFVAPMLEGRWFGTMMLSESQAGSSLADITTRAQPQEDGSYRLHGRKMWISGGDHELAENIVHLVLARTPDAPAGTRGISLFIVPKFLLGPDGSLGERNDLVLAGLNHKMGYRGTVNTAPVLGEGYATPGGRAGAVGYLVGGEHEGLRLMFTMMNEARIGVGLGATALGYTAYLKSLAYARERRQGRPLGAAPDAEPVAIVEHPDVRRMLLAQKAYAEGGLALGLYCARLADDAASLEGADGSEANRLLGLLTPIAKSWPAQWCLAGNELAIQVLGGAGYTRDHDLEQHYRDNRLNMIHEGTHGIQAMDLLGRKVLLDGGQSLGVLASRVEATCAHAESLGGDGPGLAERLRVAVDAVASATAAVATLGDQEAMLAEATAYLEAAGHIVVAWLWLSQWCSLGLREDAFAEGKRAATRYFLTRELPKVAAMLDVVRSGDRLTLDLDTAVL